MSVTLNECYWITFSSVISVCIPADLSCCCVFISAVGCVIVHSVKTKFALYFTCLFNSVLIYNLGYCTVGHFTICHLNFITKHKNKRMLN